MDEKPPRFPGTPLTRLAAVWRGRQKRAGDGLRPEDIVAESRGCKAGLARGEGRDVCEQRRLHRLAQWTCLRGRGL